MNIQDHYCFVHHEWQLTVFVVLSYKSMFRLLQYSSILSIYRNFYSQARIYLKLEFFINKAMIVEYCCQESTHIQME